MDLNDEIVLKNEGLNTEKTRNRIFKYLRQKVNAETKFNSITKSSDLDYIRDNDYVACPRFEGSRTWLLYFQSGSNNYSVSFPKHNINKQDSVRIFPVEINAKRKIYSGTIMEGTFYRMDDEKYFVIDEVYIYCGENQLLKSKKTRLRFLSENIGDFEMQEKVKIYVSKCYSTKSEGMLELYSKIKSNREIQEIIFYPQVFGKKIYRYTIIDSDLNDDIANLTKFIMKKTASPDVYNLYDIETEEKIDIAYVPDIQTSAQCKSWFKGKTKKVIVNCKLHAETNRWIPVELIE